MNAEQNIKNPGIELPPGSAPAGNYAAAVQSGDLLFLPGKAPLPIDGKLPKGRLGSSLRRGVPLTIKATVEVRRD